MDYKTLFNKASYAAINCKKNRVKANQVNQLLSLFNSPFTQDIDDTISLLMAFVSRQKSRGLFGKESAAIIISTLRKISKSVKDSKDKKKKVREFLGLLKWLFEVVEKTRIDFNVNENQSFDKIIKTVG
ncbi:MAG: hypothetical protein ACTSQP_23560 [Promethearchaeota archaeon]